MNYFFETEFFTDKSYSNKREEVDHETVANNFKNYLNNNYNDEDFSKLLSCTGFIPDLYPTDSGKETLFSKLVEVLVSEWADRMNFRSHLVKEKSGYEDINFEVDKKIVVCDAKSFRLGRSQIAPNVKDFLKPADISKWLDRHKKRLGGMVTYPDTHDWIKSSDVYLYCTDKNCPTVILSYIHLALLLHFKSKYQTVNLKNLWNYDKLFPIRLSKKISGGNRNAYWDTINSEIISILGISQNDFLEYFKKYKNLQTECIKKNIDKLIKSKEIIIKKIKTECNALSIEELRENFLEYRIENETRKIDEFIDRIRNFRLIKPNGVETDE